MDDITPLYPEPLGTWTRRWDQELRLAVPHLFNLAWQLLDASPRRKWDLLVCDDVSARLLTQFIRRVLAYHGIVLPVAYVAANKPGRLVTPDSMYRTYAAELVDPFPQPRLLVITEDAGTYRSLQYLVDCFRPVATTVDVGVGASWGRPPAGLADDWWVGGFGMRTASQAIHDTFEAAKLTDEQLAGRAKPFGGHVLNNLREAPKPGLPYVEPSDDARYLGLAEHCIRRMDDLAEWYWQLYVDTDPRVPTKAIAPVWFNRRPVSG